MCTVTIIPLGNNDFVLSSNRDEAPSRLSIAPDFYTYKNEELLYPKDKQSDGSWIGVSENKRLICLLNGGFEIHKRQPEYRLSRGVVVKDLLIAQDIEIAVENYDLRDIEPFTIVVVEWEKHLAFYELVWDGVEKHFQRLPLLPKIWSSSTLYNATMRYERQTWFKNFMETTTLNADAMFQFHTETEKNNALYGVIMDRGVVKTTSVTQVVKTSDAVMMHYHDLDKQQCHSVAVKTKSRMIYEK
jgi:hypothetical protein